MKYVSEMVAEKIEEYKAQGKTKEMRDLVLKFHESVKTIDRIVPGSFSYGAISGFAFLIDLKEALLKRLMFEYLFDEKQRREIEEEAERLQKEMEEIDSLSS